MLFMRNIRNIKKKGIFNLSCPLCCLALTKTLTKTLTMTITILSALSSTYIYAESQSEKPEQEIRQKSSSQDIPIDRVMVIVDDDIILASEMYKQIKLIKLQMQQRQLTLPPEHTLRKQVLERMILDRIQMQMAERSGVRVDDDEINRAIENIAAQNNQSLVEFQANLQQQGFAYSSFRKQIHNELITSQIQKRQVERRIKISDQDVENFLQSTAGKEKLSADYRLKHILIELPERPDPKIVAAKEKLAKAIYDQIEQEEITFESAALAHSNGRFALKGGDLGWRSTAQLPTLFSEQASTLQIGDIAEPMRSASGFHILKLVDKRGGTELFVPQTWVRHILIKPNEIRSDQQSYQLIKNLYDKLVEKAKFGELAKTFSDDPGSALNGGDLGWVMPDSMTKKFAEVMLSTPEKTISKPFRSQFGWHILEVLGKRQQDVSENYRFNQAKNILFKRHFEEELQNWLREIRQEAYIEFKPAPVAS